MADGIPVSSAATLLGIVDRGCHKYDKRYYHELITRVLRADAKDLGVFRAFTYKNSLRFSILWADDPSQAFCDILEKSVTEHLRATDRQTAMLWYAQRNGFSDAFIDRLAPMEEPFRFYQMIHLGKCGSDIDLKGLRKAPFHEDYFDECIDLLERAYTPHLDSPGSYRDDRERLLALYSKTERARCELFLCGGRIVGMYCHDDGDMECICVDPTHQRKGFGGIILRSALGAIRADTDSEPRLTVACGNHKAIRLYRKSGFTLVAKSARLTLAVPSA